MIVLAHEPQDLGDRHLAVAAGGADRLDQPLVAPAFQRRFADADRSGHLLRGDEFGVFSMAYADVRSSA